MRTPLSDKRTHGWEHAHAGWSGGDRCSAATIGHTGFTGTGLWIDFDAGRAWTLLTNRIHPTRHFDSGISDLRRQVGDHHDRSLNMQPIWSVGLMTGTVLDGNIDVALLKTDGERIEAFGPYALVPYEASVRPMLEQAQAEARVWNFEGPEPAIFAAAEQALTRAQSAAVRQVVEGAGMTMAEIGVIGFHGQTVLHRGPQKGGLPARPASSAMAS
jgi:hypothetical protein